MKYYFISCFLNIIGHYAESEVDSLKSRLQRNLWIASFFDWSTVDQSELEGMKYIKIF